LSATKFPASIGARPGVVAIIQGYRYLGHVQKTCLCRTGHKRVSRTHPRWPPDAVVRGLPDRARHGIGKARRRRLAGLTSQAALWDTFSLVRNIREGITPPPLDLLSLL